MYEITYYEKQNNHCTFDTEIHDSLNMLYHHLDIGKDILVTNTAYYALCCRCQRMYRKPGCMRSKLSQQQW